MADPRAELQELRRIEQLEAKARGPARPDPKAPTAFEQEAQRTVNTTPAELIAGAAPTRFALGAASPVLGLAQLAARNPVGRALGQDKWVDEKLRQVEEIKKRGMTAYGNDPVSEAIGLSPTTDVVGTGGAVMGPAALAAMKLPMAATAGGRIGQGTAIGAAAGATTPVTEGDDFSGSKAAQAVTGALLGAAIPGGIDVVKKGAGVARNVVDPWLPGGIDRAVGRTANTAAGPKRDAVIAALERNRQIVPGSAPTAGEAAAPVGSAEFSGLQRAVEGRRPSAYFDRATEQEGARRGAITAIGKDKAALDEAIRARSSAASKNYGEADKMTVKSDEALNELMRRPSMEKVLVRARDLAKEQGRPFAIGRDTPEEVVSGRIVGASGKPLTSETIPAQRAEYPVQNLHYVKMAMDDLIKNPERFGIGASEARAIGGTQRQFVEWLGKKAPPYETARAAYAEASVPINRMQVGQELEKALAAPLGTAERPAAFAGAVREAPRTLKKATGQPRYDELGEVLAPEQTQAVTNVLADLKRSGQHEQLAKVGVEKARDLVGQVAPTVPAAGMFSPKYSVMRAISNRLAGRVEGKSLDRMAQAMENPELMARIMKAASPSERQAIVEALLAQKVGRGAVIGGATVEAQAY